MKRWRGRWLLAVAAIHTLFAAVAFGGPLRAMARDGMLDSVHRDPERGVVAWCVLFGGVLAVAALAVDQLEARRAPLRTLGFALLAVVALGLVWMPASGFWLALAPALSMALARGEGA